MSGLIGYSGLLGRVLKDTNSFESEYNSKNIQSLRPHNCLIIAAPSSNRLWANRNADLDLQNIRSLINQINKNKPEQLILLGTVDSIHAPHTAYGRHRKFLEDYVKSNIPKYHIIRLCTLIHPWISKNLLYDLKHQKFLDSINPNLIAQWYDLSRLHHDIDRVVGLNIQDINLVSEPIPTKEILDYFFPNLAIGPPVDSEPYNLTCAQAKLLGPHANYIMNKSEVFNSIQKYLIW